MGLTNEQKDKLTEFIKFTIKDIGIKNPPTIRIQNNRDGLKTTAAYDYSGNEKIVKVYGKNRHIVDIMRSSAHELVHHKQFEDGRLEKRPPDIGGEIEDEANSIAGQLIKKYYKIDNTIYDE